MPAYQMRSRRKDERTWVFLACFLGILAALVVWVASAVGQDPPVAEAARRARQQRKQAPPAKRVWTNDDVATLPAIGIRAPLAAEAEGATPEPAGEPGPLAGAAPEGREKERAEVQGELKTKKAALDRARQELDLLQREHDLKRQQFYSNPNYSSDSAGRAALDTLQSQIQTKREEGQQLEAQIAALEEKLKALDQELGPPKQAPLTPAEERASWEAKLRPLREELARVEADLARVRSRATPPAPGSGGNPTTDLILQLESRRTELQRQISDLEDQARRGGVPAGWIR